jgi:hypothetical protein
MAQVAGTFSDPLTPQLQTNPQQPPTFQPFNRRQQTNAGRPTTFQPFTRRQQANGDQPASFPPMPSGAGATGFDATNSPTRATRSITATSAETTTDAATSDATTSATYNGSLANDPLAPTSLAAPQPSPYDAPVPPLPGSQALAAAPPGAPPVEIGPIRKPKKQKAHADEPTDPFAPAGIHAGSFLFYPSLELIGGYNTNPGAFPDGPGAWLYTVSPELQVQSQWSRHELKADLRGSYTGYDPDQTPTLSRPYFDGKVDGRIDVTRDTHVLLRGTAVVSTDNPSSPNLQAGLSTLPVFITYGGSGGVRQSFNRFELTAKGEVDRTAYQDSTLTDGTTVSNADRNYDQVGGTLRGSYETLPGVKPFVEVEADSRTHDTAVDSYGYARDSKGVTGLVGTTFDIKRTLTGEVAVGYTRRTYDDPRLAPLEGVVGDASLIWNADALNTVKLTVTSVASESTIPGVSGELSRDVNLQVDHAFRRWLIGSLKFGMGWDVYQGGEVSTTTSTVCDCVVTSSDSTAPDRVDKRYTVGVGVTYKVDRTLWLKGEFRQDWLRSNVSGVDYNASTLLFGLQLQR